MASATDRVWKRALRDLEATGARYAVVGAVAAGVHGRIRTTKDIDVAVDVADDTEAEAVVRSLVARGYLAGSLIEESATGRIAAVRFVAPGLTGDAPDLDLLFASCGIEPEIVAAAERAVLMRGLESPVASRGRLLAMNLLSVGPDRPRDAEDLEALAAKANAGDFRTARSAVRLMAERRSSRGRSLERDLDRLIRSARRRRKSS